MSCGYSHHGDEKMYASLKVNVFLVDDNQIWRLMNSCLR